MWKKVALGGAGLLALAFVALCAVIAMQPATQHVARSRAIAASPEDLWPLVSDLKAFSTWSPWEEIDPAMSKAFSDPSSGPGAWYTWDGNDDVGKGRMEIATVEPPLRVTERLVFLEPFESKADVTLAFAKKGEATEVTWAFDMEQNFASKAFGLVMDMDAMLGADFEKGLARLDAVATARAAERIAAEQAAVEKAAAEAAAQAAAPPAP